MGQLFVFTKMDLKNPVFVVKSGRSKGLFGSREEAIKLTRGYPNAAYEKITNLNDLLRYCEDVPELHNAVLEYCKLNGFSVKLVKSNGVNKLFLYEPVLQKTSNSSVNKSSSSSANSSKSFSTSPRLGQKVLAVQKSSNYNNSSFDESSQSSVTEEDDRMVEDKEVESPLSEKEPAIDVYISSSQISNKHGKDICAISVSCYNNFNGRSHLYTSISERLPADQPQTKEVADLYSLIRVLEILPLDRDIKVYTTSSYITSVAKHVHEYKSDGWPTNVPHIFMIRYLSFLWDRRQALTEIHRSSSLMSKDEAKSNAEKAANALNVPASKSLSFKLPIPENY